ncbi:methyl-accepting chemotaxis protein [Nitrospira defluvii]|nr:methyl-accepting chemotaxis protein [Nitrospira defluvii]
MLKKMGIESKFSLTASLGIVALLIAGSCVMLSFMFVKNEWAGMSQGFQIKKTHLLDMRNQIGHKGSIHNSFANYIVSGKKKDLDGFLEGIDEMVIGMESYRTISSLTQVETFSLKEIMDLLGKYRNEAYRAQQLWGNRNMTRRERQSFTISNTTRLANINSLLSEMDRAVLTHPTHFINRIDQLMAVLGGIFIALVLIVAVFGFRIMRSIVKPLGNSVQELSKVASGNLIERVEASSREEIGRMAESVNQAVSRMYSIMSPLDYNAGVPSNIPETMDWVSRQINTPSAETSATHSKIHTAEEGEAEEIDATQQASSDVSKTSKKNSHFQEVANEVKSLANDTIQATDDICREIEAIQKSTKGAIRAITQVTSVMGKVNQKYSQVHH